MDFYQNTDEQVENVDNDEYIEKDYATRQKVEREPEESRYKKWNMSREKNKVDEESETEEYTPSRSSNKKKNKGRKTFPVKLIFKLLVIAAVYFNFKFIWNFMKEPMGYTFYHTLVVLGICAGINFLAVWILFYKKSFMRFYLSVFSILGSLGYYFYVNYTNHSFLGNHMITSVLVIISVLMVINPKVHYYLKSIVLLLISIIGIYVSGNKFALVWALMLSAGLILLFRVTKLKADSKSNKKEDQTRRNQKQSA